MDAKQKLNSTNPAHCPISGYSIYTYSSFPETFITLFRASMGGYDVSDGRGEDTNPWKWVSSTLETKRQKQRQRQRQTETVLSISVRRVRLCQLRSIDQDPFCSLHVRHADHGMLLSDSLRNICSDDQHPNCHDG